MSIRFGCQTYTWQMSYKIYKDRLSAILDTIQQAGFTGVEAEVCMMGRYYEDPALFRDALERRGLQLAALTLAESWLHTRETQDERANANRLLRYLSHFPGAKLILVQLPGRDRSHLTDRQRTAISCVNDIAKRAKGAGIEAAYHPNSPAGSVFRTAEDYRVLFEGLDDRYVGYCPDTGHIANGGMDVLQVLQAHQNCIRHIHYKDFDLTCREWRPMGEGSLPHKQVTDWLRQVSYSGWIMVEEESVFAESAPDEATLANGKYIQKKLTTA